MSCSASSIPATEGSPRPLPHRPGTRPGAAWRLFPFLSGVLPEDFTERLERLKEATGLTWNGFADALGVDRKQVLRWKDEGTEPCGGAMLSIIRLAAVVPGGLDIIMGGGFLDSLGRR